MRTRLTCGRPVAHDGRGHVLWKDAEPVCEDDRILFACVDYEGRVDRETDAGTMLVVPASKTPTCSPASAPRTA